MNLVKQKLTLSELSLSLLLCFSAETVVAGDMGPIEPELWAGPYFGIHAGSGAGHVRQNSHETTIQPNTLVTTVDGVTTTITSTSIENFSGTLHGNVTGSIANLFIGYNFHKPYSQFVVSGQLEGTLFSDITLKGSGANSGSTLVVATGAASGSGTITNLLQQYDELKSTFNFIARAGYLARENALIYVLGGVVEGHFVRPDFFDNSFNDRRSLWTTGGTVGAGMEYKFCENLSFLAEYRYATFSYKRNPNNSTSGETTQMFGGTVTNSTFSSQFNRNLSNHVNYNLGQIGIVYRI